MARMQRVDSMKREFEGNPLSPLPVALVGAMVDGRSNYLVIGYISPFNFGRHVFFSLFKRYTRIGIQETGRQCEHISPFFSIS